MNLYLQDIPLPEAQARLEVALLKANLDGILAFEEIALDEIRRILHYQTPHNFDQNSSYKMR